MTQSYHSLQDTQHSVAWTLRAPSTWTQWPMTTTRASSLATRIPPASMWWCGSRRSRHTGRRCHFEPWLSLAFSLRSRALYISITVCLNAQRVLLPLPLLRWGLGKSRKVLLAKLWSVQKYLTLVKSETKSLFCTSSKSQLDLIILLKTFINILCISRL